MGAFLHNYDSRGPVPQEPTYSVKDQFLKAIEQRNRGVSPTAGLPSDAYPTPSPRGNLQADTVFHYSPVHDLESLWWIAVYFVMNKETAPVIPPSQQARPSALSLTEDHRRFARSLFYTLDARAETMRNLRNSAFDKHVKTLPDHLQPICDGLVHLRQTLSTHYYMTEAPESKSSDSIEPLYVEFRAIFGNLARMLLAQDITVTPISPDPNEDGMLPSAVRCLASARTTRDAQPTPNSKRKSRTEDLPSLPVPKKHKSSGSAEASSNVSKGTGSVSSKAK